MVKTVRFETNVRAAKEIVEALDEVLGGWAAMSEKHQTQHALLSALRSEFASGVKEIENES